MGFPTQNGGHFLRYTRFEKARIIGARALQISLGAPVLVEKPKDLIDPLQVAMLEFGENAIPIVPKKSKEWGKRQ